MIDKRQRILILENSLAELLEICRWKCSPTDDIVLTNGKPNAAAMADAMAILQGNPTAEQIEGTMP